MSDETMPQFFESLTRAELLLMMEHVPQHFWPHAPTRQNKQTLKSAIVHAHRTGHYTPLREHAGRVEKPAKMC
jgi:hypothetical protein